MDENSWARIGPPWLERLGYTIERSDAKTSRTGQARHLLAVTAALSLAALLSAITHALLIALTGAAVAALVALLALAGRRWIVPRRRPLIPAPDPQLTQRTRTTVTWRLHDWLLGRSIVGRVLRTFFARRDRPRAS